MMPQLTGYDVCRQIRQKHDVDSLPVIFLTAKNQVSDLMQSFAAGANDYLTKPISKDELLARVETHLTLLDSQRNLEHQVKHRTKQLIQAEKMASLGVLTDGVAHEISHPASFIQISSQNLQQDIQKLQQLVISMADDDTDDAVLNHFRQHFNPLFSHIDTIESGTERIQNIVKDLQTFSQKDNDKIVKIDVIENLNATVNLVQTRYANTVEFVTHFNSNPSLYGNPMKLNQVFLQLVVNACEAIVTKLDLPLTSTVQASNLTAKPGKIELSCHQQDQTLMINIADNGCGIKENQLDKLVDPFYTTKSIGQGSGLGLSVAYNIIAQHNGELEFTSTPSEGTLCTIKLPLNNGVN